MKLGISSYCLDREIEQGRMTLAEAIDWAAAQGAQCMELVPFAFRFDDPATGKIDTQAIVQVKKQAQRAEIDRLKHEIDIAAELGLPRMRHDVCAFRRPQGQNTPRDFERMLPRMAEAARELTQYGRSRGVQTLIENHGFFANGSDRVIRILDLVDDDNYGLLLDTGNVICVDEDPAIAARTLAPLCRMVHLKDFYIRTRDPGDSTQFDCAGSWFRSRGGRYLRGAILAQGDLDIDETLSALKHSGYDGHIVIEFEGMEDARYATSVGLHNARRIWDQV